MEIKASGQVTIIDVTDAYSITLTRDTYTLTVGENEEALVGLTCDTRVVVYQGNQLCESINVGDITCPDGIIATLSDNNTSAPLITFTVTGVVTSACEAVIPLTIDDITVDKKFSFAIAKPGDNGESIKSVTRYYCFASIKPDKPTTNPPDESWTEAEPAYEYDPAVSLYFVDLIVLTDDSFEYSEVSKSSSYSAVNGVQVGGVNLIRNSEDLLFTDYYFDSTYVDTGSDDGVLQKETDDMTLVYQLSLNASYDGAGNVILK